MKECSYGLRLQCVCARESQLLKGDLTELAFVW